MPDPAQRLMIAAEAAAKAPDSHLAQSNLQKVLVHIRETEISNAACWPRTARVYYEAAKALSRSHESEERECLAAVILSLSRARWRSAQGPRIYRPPRADIYA